VSKTPSRELGQVNVCPMWSPERAREHLQAFRNNITLGRPSEIERASKILLQGSRLSDILFLESGVVKLVRTCHQTGSKRLVSLCYPGQIIGTTEPVTSWPHDVLAIAVTACKVYRVEAEKLRELIKSDAQAAYVIVQLQEYELNLLLATVYQMKVLWPHERLERLFRELAMVLNPWQTGSRKHLVIPLSSKELAELLGISFVHLKRSLSRLERAGKVKKTTAHGIMLLNASGRAGNS